jgi:hypothetical protein
MYNHQHSHGYVNAQMHKHTDKTQYKNWDEITIARCPVYKLNRSTKTSITYVLRQCKHPFYENICMCDLCIQTNATNRTDKHPGLQVWNKLCKHDRNLNI